MQVPLGLSGRGRQTDSRQVHSVLGLSADTGNPLLFGYTDRNSQLALLKGGSSETSFFNLLISSVLFILCQPVVLTL